MAESEVAKFFLSITKIELQILVYALSSTNPVDREHELIQFTLYQKLLDKLNGVK